MTCAAGRKGSRAEPEQDCRILRLGSDKLTRGSGALPRDRDESVDPYLEAVGGQGWELVAVVLDGRWADSPPPCSSSGPPGSRRSPHPDDRDHGRLPGPTTDTGPNIMGGRTGRRTAPIL